MCWLYTYITADGYNLHTASFDMGEIQKHNLFRLQ